MCEWGQGRGGGEYGARCFEQSPGCDNSVIMGPLINKTYPESKIRSTGKIMKLLALLFAS